MAVNKGFINEEQLAEAMILQIHEDLCGLEHRLIGQILLSLGYIREPQIAIILGAMKLPLTFCEKQLRQIPA